MVFRWMASEAISWGESGANYMTAVVQAEGKAGSKALLIEGL